MYKNQPNPVTTLKKHNPDIDFNSMEHILAKEMAALNQDEVRKTIELRKLALESEEIKSLKL